MKHPNAGRSFAAFLVIMLTAVPAPAGEVMAAELGRTAAQGNG